VVALVVATLSPLLAAAQNEPNVTFSRDVAPILHEHCVACHHPDGIGQFSLLSYDDVRPWARGIRQQVMTRQMPPWKPVAGYGRFLEERTLTDAEVETIRRWVDVGAPEGDRSDLPPPPPPRDGWELGQPDLVVTMDETYTLPAGNEDVFRNFVIPIPVTETRYVRTLELHPGAPSTVHHAIMAIDETSTSRRRDAGDEAPGFEGMDMGLAYMPDGHLVGWTPGMSPFPGIEGAPWRLDPGTDLVLQLHLLPSQEPVDLKATVGFFFDNGPAEGAPMHVIRLDADHELDIPPGERDFVVTDAVELPVDVTVHAVYPHAHLIGKSTEGWAILPDGSREWLIKIDDWDFAWQDIYRLATPLQLPAGTTLHMRFSYDNSETNPSNPSSPPQRVTAGNRSSDEMAHLQLQVQPESAETLPKLEQALYRRAIERNPANPWSHRGLGNALRDDGRLDDAVSAYEAGLRVDPEHAPSHLDLGAVLTQLGQVELAVLHFEEAVRFDPDSADAFYDLGTALILAGRPEQGIAPLQEAVRLEPGLADAHTNLGQALLSVGRTEEAVGQLEQSVQLRPDSAKAHNNLGAALGTLGRFEEAVGHFQRVLAIDPTDTQARENLELAQEMLSAPPE
jgi:Flp pilus assembly protein TadD